MKCISSNSMCGLISVIVASLHYAVLAENESSVFPTHQAICCLPEIWSQWNLCSISHGLGHWSPWRLPRVQPWQLRCFFCALVTLLLVRRDMQKVLRWKQRRSTAMLSLSAQKVVVAVSMAEEQAALNRCECNAVFQSLPFLLTMSGKPLEDSFWNGRVFCHPQAMRHLHLFCGLRVLCH